MGRFGAGLCSGAPPGGIAGFRQRFVSAPKISRVCDAHGERPTATPPRPLTVRSVPVADVQVERVGRA